MADFFIKLPTSAVDSIIHLMNDYDVDSRDKFLGDMLFFMLSDESTLFKFLEFKFPVRFARLDKFPEPEGDLDYETLYKKSHYMMCDFFERYFHEFPRE